eukprot:jgi/Psemu1/52780/gm1.52780_g
MRELVQDDQVLAIAARTARYNSDGNKDPTIRLELSIQHWGFRSGWFPYKFTKVYDKNGGATAFETSKSLEPMPTAMSYDARVANILKFSRRIISHENEFCLDLPDPYFEYIAFKQIYRMAFPPSYTWTWKYSPNSDSVSFHRVRSNSISFRRSTSSSSSRVRCQEKSNTTPIQCQDKSTVTASHETPSTPNSDHHVPPLAPTNFRWTFNPQNEIATFRRVPTTSVPTSQPPMCHQLLPSATLASNTDHPNAAPAYTRSLQSQCHNPISSRPNRPPVLRLSKRHRDALKVKLYHLYANILSMNCCFTPPNYLPRRHRDAIQIKLYQLHATLLIANLLYDGLTPSSAIPHSVFSWCPFLQTLFWTSVNDDNFDGLFGQFIASALLRSLLRHSVISLPALSSALVFLSFLFTPYFSLPPSSIILLYGLKPLILCDYIVFPDLIDQQWNQSSTTLESFRIKSRLIPAIVSYIPATPICSGSPLLVNQGVYVLCPKATTTGFAYSGIH